MTEFPNPHSYYQLKVKRNHLASEARIIRRIELKRLERARKIERKYPAAEGEPQKISLPRLDYTSLNEHRVKGLRPEARATHLAAMFLKGVDLSRVEDPERTQTSPDWKRVENIVSRFATGDSRVILQRFAEWRDAGTSQPVAA